MQECQHKFSGNLKSVFEQKKILKNFNFRTSVLSTTLHSSSLSFPAVCVYCNLGKKTVFPATWNFVRVTLRFLTATPIKIVLHHYLVHTDTWIQLKQTLYETMKHFIKPHYARWLSICFSISFFENTGYSHQINFMILQIGGNLQFKNLRYWKNCFKNFEKLKGPRRVHRLIIQFDLCISIEVLLRLM